MAVYFNEFDPYAAQWLRNLIAAGHLPAGEVDERSIIDVGADDLKGFAQCHFFSGIGGWSLAARLAGWPDERQLWSGSCPCQPFSTAGKRKGQSDERHLWPVFFDLIAAHRPKVVFGEQVGAAIDQGWLDGVHTDLENAGYACEAFIIPAVAVDAPHKRDRIWFVADASGVGRDGRQDAAEGHDLAGTPPGWQESPDRPALRAGSFWGAAEWAVGSDGRRRRYAPGPRPLADGVSAGVGPMCPESRMGRLKAYGNAIVPQVAAEVIKAYLAYRP